MFFQQQPQFEREIKTRVQQYGNMFIQYIDKGIWSFLLLLITYFSFLHLTRSILLVYSPQNLISNFLPKQRTNSSTNFDYLHKSLQKMPIFSEILILISKGGFWELITKLMYVFSRLEKKRNIRVIPLKVLNYNAEKHILLYRESEACGVMRWIKGLLSSLVPSISY